MISALRHEALRVSGTSSFVETAVAVLGDALARHAVPVVFADGKSIDQVRDALGASGAAVLGFDMSVDGRNPARVLPALQRYLDDYPSDELCCVGEAARVGEPDRVVREVELHELLLHLPAFQDWNCQLICTYDPDVLPPDVVAAIEGAHGEAVSDPVDRVDRARGQSLPPRPARSEELGVDRTTLGALRGFIEKRAAAAGLDDERVDDLVYAVNEVVTNSLCHGEGRARVSLWLDPDAVVCEVRDRGWIRDPLAGRIAPRPDRVNGRGLWLVNQLCDLVQLRSSPAGTTVRMYVDR